MTIQKIRNRARLSENSQVNCVCFYVLYIYGFWCIFVFNLCFFVESIRMFSWFLPRDAL